MLLVVFMAKPEKVIKEVPTQFIKIRKSYYLLVPAEVCADSAFPFDYNTIFKKKKLSLKMFKDKIVVEEE